MEETLSAGPERQRRGGAARAGPNMGPSIMGGMEPVKGKRGRQRGPPLNPQQKGAEALRKGLTRFDEYFPSDELKNNLRDEFVGFDQIRYMNGQFLAMVLAFLLRNQRLTKNSFTDANIEPYIDKLPHVTFKSLDTASRKAYKASMLRYIRAIQQFRTR